MDSQDRVGKALAALRNADRELEAPDRVEARLLEAFQERHARRGHASWWLIGAFAAGVVAWFLLGRTAGLRPVPTPVAPVRELASEGPVVRPSQAVEVEVRPAVPKQTAHRLKPVPREVVTEFFPLMDVAPPLGRGQLLRLSVPASTMLTVGLPVREERMNERVQADVLVGEEGMARAIRFVSQQY